MLFGTTADTDSSDAGPDDELRLCTLNVHSPSPGRGQRIADWLLAAKAGVLVLTEMKPSQGCDAILACLQAEGYTTTTTPGWRDGGFFATIAVRGYETVAVAPPAFDPRITALDLTAGATTIRIVGIYAPANGMTAESSHTRRAFQSRATAYLRQIQHPALLVAGDLNVVEPDHQPRLPAFADHDYNFYTDLLALGLRDAYRTINPHGGDHSWINPQYGSQRLDHILASESVGEIRSCAYDHTTRDTELSDHAALLTTLDPRTHSGGAVTG